MTVVGRTVDIDDSKGRTHQHMTDTLMNFILHSNIDIDDRKNLEDFKKKHVRFFFYVGFGDEDYEIFQKYSASYPFLPWLYALDRAKAAHSNGLYFYDQFEGTSDMRNGPYPPLVGGIMDDFTRKYLFLLRSLSDNGMERLFVHSQAAMLLFYPDTNEERGVQIPFWHGIYKKIMKEFLCIQIPLRDQRNIHELREWLGVENDLSPAMRIIDRKDGRWRFFQLRQKITIESIESFYEDYITGRLKEFQRSEGPEREHGILKKFVGKTFHKYIRRKDLDVVVIIHSKENERLSKRVLKIGQLAAKILARFEYLRFGKIDANLNSDPYIPQRGYPLIRIFKKGNLDEYVDFPGLFTTKELT